MSSLVMPVINPAWKRATGTYLAWKTTTNAAAVGGVTRHPVGFTFDEVIRFLYGIRTFRIQATAVGVVNPGTGFDTPYSLNYNQVLTVGARNQSGSNINTGFTSEANLVTYQHPTANTGTLFHQQVFDTSFVNMWSHQWHLMGNDSQPEIPSGTTAPSFSGLVFGSLFYPALFNVVAIGNMGLISGFGSATLGVGQTFGYGAGGGNNSGLRTGTFLGKSFQYSGTSASPFTMTSSSFVVTADSYWPYDPGSGGAIYNTSTGAQLRNPFAL